MAIRFRNTPRSAEARARPSIWPMSAPRAKLLPDPGPPRQPIVNGASVSRWAISSANGRSTPSRPQASSPNGTSAVKVLLLLGDGASPCVPRRGSVGAIGSGRAPATALSIARMLISFTLQFLSGASTCDRNINVRSRGSAVEAFRRSRRRHVALQIACKCAPFAVSSRSGDQTRDYDHENAAGTGYRRPPPRRRFQLHGILPPEAVSPATANALEPLRILL